MTTANDSLARADAFRELRHAIKNALHSLGLGVELLALTTGAEAREKLADKLAGEVAAAAALADQIREEPLAWRTVVRRGQLRGVIDFRDGSGELVGRVGPVSTPKGVRTVIQTRDGIVSFHDSAGCISTPPVDKLA